MLSEGKKTSTRLGFGRMPTSDKAHSNQSVEETSASTGQDSRPGLRRKATEAPPEPLISAYFENGMPASKKATSQALMAQIESSVEKGPRKGR